MTDKETMITIFALILAGILGWAFAKTSWETTEPKHYDTVTLCTKTKPDGQSDWRSVCRDTIIYRNGGK